MATHQKSGRAIVWHKNSFLQVPGRNFPTIEDILEAARREFPDCRPADLQLISCGEDILLEEKMI